MANAMICDNCQKPYGLKTKGTQDLNMTTFLGKTNKKGYDYKQTVRNLCSKCAVK